MERNQFNTLYFMNELSDRRVYDNYIRLNTVLATNVFPPEPLTLSITCDDGLTVVDVELLFSLYSKVEVLNWKSNNVGYFSVLRKSQKVPIKVGFTTKDIGNHAGYKEALRLASFELNEKNSVIIENAIDIYLYNKLPKFKQDVYNNFYFSSNESVVELFKNAGYQNVPEVIESLDGWVLENKEYSNGNRKGTAIAINWEKRTFETIGYSSDG